MASDPTVIALSGNPVVAEAMENFKRCQEFESVTRERWLNDLRFANGDSENLFQWPNEIRAARELDNKPCLTMNITRQHNLIVSNEMRKAKASVRFRATGDGATVKAAQVWEDIMRDIEIRSDAQTIYTQGRNFMVDAGIGYWRLATQYVDETTFDQEIVILPVNDPLAVFLDPDIQKKDGSDAKFALVFDYMQRKDFDEQYPEYADRALPGMSPLGDSLMEQGINAQDRIWFCEYFRKVFQNDELISFVHNGERVNIRRSLLPENMISSVMDGEFVRKRPIRVPVWEWKMIVGEEIVDETIWPGKWCPIVRCVGEESIIDGVLDRKGHTRAMKDAQRMYNYSASGQVESVALQGKTPWVAPVQAIEGYETYWDTANVVNHSVMPYNAFMDDGTTPIPPPMRQEPPKSSEAFQTGLQNAMQQIMMVSGQYQNQMGEQGNERTGAAIGRRQEQGATATFHFVDNYNDALVFTGKQILDLAPKIYDTKRVKTLMSADGTDYSLTLDPKAAQVLQEQRNAQGDVVSRVLNPTKGQFDVAPQAGPEYSTKRQENVEALTLVLTQAPTLVPIIGDLLLGSSDFDKAQEAAQRLRRMVPPEALGEGPTAREKQLQMAVQQLQAQLAETLQLQAKNEIKLVGKDQMRDIDVYKAETDRIKALLELISPQAGAAMGQQVAEDVAGTQINDVVNANREGIEPDGEQEQGVKPETPPMPGARKAPDGQWYLPDPTRQGKYLRVRPQAGVGAV